MARAITLLAAFSLALVAGCRGSADHEVAATVGAIEVSNPYLAEPVTTDAAAVYFTMSNTGDDLDSLVAISAPWAEQGQLHRQVEEAGAMRMEPVVGIAIPAGGTVRLRPGGLHGMLLRLGSQPTHDEEVEVVLRFARAGEISISFSVVTYAELERYLGAHEQDEP